MPAFKVGKARDAQRLAQGAQPRGASGPERELRRRAIALIPADRGGKHPLTGRDEEDADQRRKACCREDELHVKKQRGAAALMDSRLDPLCKKGTQEAVRGAREE